MNGQMIETLKEVDTQWFLWINSHHNTVLDWVLWTLSQHWSWAIVMVLSFCLLTLRHEPRRWWLVLAGIVLCFLLADQGSVHLFKETVGRLRPCHTHVPHPLRWTVRLRELACSQCLRHHHLPDCPLPSARAADPRADTLGSGHLLQPCLSGQTLPWRPSLRRSVRCTYRAGCMEVELVY